MYNICYYKHSIAQGSVAAAAIELYLKSFSVELHRPLASRQNFDNLQPKSPTKRLYKKI